MGFGRCVLATLPRDPSPPTAALSPHLAFRSAPGFAGDGGAADAYRDRERGQVQAQEVPPGVQEELPRRQDR